MSDATPESKIAALPAKVLHFWVEYTTYMRIVEGPRGKQLQMALGGRWQAVRRVSDSEYDLVFRSHAERWQRGESPMITMPPGLLDNDPVNP